MSFNFNEYLENRVKEVTQGIVEKFQGQNSDFMARVKIPEELSPYQYIELALEIEKALEKAGARIYTRSWKEHEKQTTHLIINGTFRDCKPLDF